MRKYIIVIISIICLSLALSCFTYKSIASMGLDALQNPDSYIQGGGDSTELISIGNIIVWLVRTLGESIAVIMLLIIGIKYLLGSVEEKAEYKQTMWPYVIGAVLIFAGSAFVDIIYKAFN